MGEACKLGGPTKDNNNCTNPADDDGLPVQCIGAWSRDKHHYLNLYLKASSNPRRKFLPPEGAGGAAFIDLFAGPGRARVATTGEIVDGSPLIALKQPVPFSRVILCELDRENVEALEQRTARYRGVKIIPGDCNKNIAAVVADVPSGGLNVALLDPFNLAPLDFETIGRLADFRRMDLIVFFPVGEIRRFLREKPKIYAASLDRALGTSEWRKTVTSGRGVEGPQLIDIFRAQLVKHFGYGATKTYTTPMCNRQGTVLYHLVFASKHPKADEIWEGITKRTPSGQRRLF